MKFGRAVVGSVWTRSVHWLLQAKMKTTVFLWYLKCTVTPVIWNRSSQSQWQTHEYCVGSELCCREKFGKFLMGTEPEPNTTVFPISYAQPARTYTANQWYWWKMYTLKVCFFMDKTTGFQGPPNGVAQSHKNWSSRTLFYPSYPMYSNWQNSKVGLVLIFEWNLEILPENCFFVV